MKIKRMLGDRLLVKRERTEGVTAGGIVVPDKARKRQPNEGTVVMVSPDCDAEVEVGQTVFFKAFSGQTIYLEDEPLLVLAGHEVDAVAEASA